MKSQINNRSKNIFKMGIKNLIVAAVLLISVSSFAQDQVQPDKKLNKQKKEKMTPEQKNQAMLDKLTAELKLDAKQQDQIKPIIAEQSAKMQAMRAERMAGSSKEMTDAEKEAFKEKRKADKKETEAKFKAILTPEQFKKMKEIEEANKEKMREMREMREAREPRENNITE